QNKAQDTTRASTPDNKVAVGNLPAEQPRRRTIEQEQAERWDRPGTVERTVPYEETTSRSPVEADGVKVAALPGSGSVEPPRRRPKEQEQADRWDRGEHWKPVEYDPEGETDFIKGVREDKAAAQAELDKAEQTRRDSHLPDGAWDQVHGDPIGHAIQ